MTEDIEFRDGNRILREKIIGVLSKHPDLEGGVKKVVEEQANYLLRLKTCEPTCKSAREP